MRRFAVIVFVLAICGTAAAAGGSGNTALESKGMGRGCSEGTCHANMLVRVSSNKKPCVENRRVVFFAVYDDGSKSRIDSDRATRDGYSGGYGAAQELPEGVLAKAPAVTSDGVTCKQAKLKSVFPGLP